MIQTRLLSLSAALLALLIGATYSLQTDYAKTTTTFTCTPWNDVTIGSATGSAVYDDCQTDTISITSDGFVSTFTTADSQHVVHQTLCGNGEITARVLGMTPSQSGFAGVFIRESLDPGARKVAILTQFTNQIIRQHRLTTNFYQTHAVTATSSAQWLRLTRSGNLIIGWYSTDGFAWVQAFSIPLGMNTCVEVGLVAYSASGITTTVDFDNVTVDLGPAGPATVAFSDSALSANTGDTIQICATITNPCQCDPASVDVTLQGNGSPYLSNYTTQTLVFSDTSTQQCFDLVIGSGTLDTSYLFQLGNISGGNQAQIGLPDELTVTITGDTTTAPPKKIDYCGWFTKAPPANLEDVAYFDRFGNLYTEEEVAVPEIPSGGNPCDCTEFDETEIPNLDESFFNLFFRDCAENTNMLFGSTAPANNNTTTVGREFRRVTCRAFAELSQLIIQSSPPCASNDPSPRVSIEVLRFDSGPTTQLGTARAGASAYYPASERVEGGLIDGLPWQIINSGSNQHLPANSFHGFLVANPNTAFYFDDDDSALDGSGLVDFYTVVLHEGLHILGFASLIEGGTGEPLFSDLMSYSRYDHYLWLSNGNNVINMNQMNSYEWNIHMPIADLHASCLNGEGILGPDMLFNSNDGDSYPVFTDAIDGDQLRSAFSHLSDDCDGNLMEYLMADGIAANERVEVGNAELDVLCTLGYQLAAPQTCDCVVAGNDDFGPACTEDKFTLELCPGADNYLDILITDITDNDVGADGVAFVEPALLFDHGIEEITIENDVIRIRPCVTGVHELKYVPTSTTCPQPGNVSFIYIEVTRCDDVCGFIDENVTIDLGYNDYPNCNIICNTEVHSDHEENQLLPTKDCLPGALTNSCLDVPGWFAAVHTPDFFPANSTFIPNTQISVFPGSGALRGKVQQISGDEAIEAFYTRIDPDPEDYLFSFYVLTLNEGDPNPPDVTIKASLVTEGIIDQFSSCLSSTDEIDFNLGTQLDLVVSNQAVQENAPVYKRVGTCFDLDGAIDYQALWFSVDFFSSSDYNISYFIDQVELVKDDFDAGSNITSTCGTEVTLGGQNFCMLTDVVVNYDWKREESDGSFTSLLSYTVEKDNTGTLIVNGQAGGSIPALTTPVTETTHFWLERSVVDGGGMQNFSFCQTADEVIVTITEGLADPNFQTDATNEPVYTFTADDMTAGNTHQWLLDGVAFGGNGPTATTSSLEPGTYTITHIITNICGSDQAATSITVTISNTPLFSYETDCQFVSFFGQEEADTYLWDFGTNADPSASTAANSIVIFDASGLHTVTLTTTTNGVTATYSEQIVVEDCGANLSCSVCNTQNTYGVAGEEKLLTDVGLAPDLTSGQTICLQGRIIVNAPYAFVNSKLLMQPGASLVVDNGQALTLVSNQIVGCDKMWRGIELKSGGRIKMDDNIVADAQYAIFVPSEVSTPNTSAGLSGTRNTFRNNFVGILVPANNNVPFNNGISTNRFINDNDLKAPFTGQSAAPEGLPEQESRSLAGVILNRVDVFSSFSNDFINLTSGVLLNNTEAIFSENEFTNLLSQAGVYNGFDFKGHAINSLSEGAQSLEVINNEFTHCYAGISTRGVSFTGQQNQLLDVNRGMIISAPSAGGVLIGGVSTMEGNTLEQTQTGIVVFNPDPMVNVLIENNTVEASTFGIVLPTAQAVVRDNNPITITDNGIGILLLFSRDVLLDNNIIDMTSTNARSGINLSFASDCTLQNNTITGSGVTGSENYGIHLRSSSGNVYCCNSVENTRNGVRVDGDNLATNDLRSTSFRTHQRGLFLEGLSAILGGQEHTENAWYSGSGGAEYFGLAPIEAQAYPFLVDNSFPNGSPLFLPEDIPDGWFDNSGESPNNQPMFCPTTDCISSDLNPVDPDIKRIALGEINAGIYSSTIQWELDRYLYRKVVGQQIQDTTIQNFVSVNDSNSVGAFYALDDGLLGALTGNLTEFAQLKNNVAEIRGKLQQVVAIDKALLTATETEADSLQLERDSFISEMIPLIQSDSALQATVLATRASACVNLFNQNAGVSASEIFEQNQKTVNSWYLQYLIKSMKPLASPGLASLDTIAQQCPLSGGHAVFQARALIAMSTGDITFYDDETACTGGQSLQAPPQSHFQDIAVQAELRVFPNPAADELTIVKPIDVEEAVEVILFDAFGKQVQRIQLKEPSKTIDVGQLAEGIYFIQLYSKQKKYAAKIVIHR